MIFGDTSVWYAAYVEEEPDHDEADALLAEPGTRLVTTDYVIDELLTLLVSRRHRPVAKVLGRLLWSGAVCQIIWGERFDVRPARGRQVARVRLLPQRQPHAQEF